MPVLRVAASEAAGRSSPRASSRSRPTRSLLANLAPGLDRRDAAGRREVLAWAGTPLATAEVALVCGVDQDEARVALAEAGAVERPVGPDAYWSL